jgi:hypothetical protein
MRLLHRVLIAVSAFVLLRMSDQDAAKPAPSEVPKPNATQDPFAPLLMKLGEIAPALMMQWQAERAAASRDEATKLLELETSSARQEAFAWRELGLRFARDGYHELAAKCHRHASVLEEEHELFGEDDAPPPPAEETSNRASAEA